MRLKDIIISKFINLKNTKDSLSITMFEELKHIKNGTYKNQIIECRNAINSGDLELYKMLKNKLPAVTFCGQFQNGRKITNLFYYNNLMIIDIDKLNIIELNSLKKILSEDEYIMSIWDSPSGNGLKCLIQIDSNVNKHKAVFNSVKKYLFDKYKIEIDISGSDITRLCFSSWDQNIIFKKAKIYTGYILDEIKVTKSFSNSKNVILDSTHVNNINNPSDLKLIKNILAFLVKNNSSITKTHQDWFKVASALSTTFSHDIAEVYYLKLCRLDKDKHDENKSINLLKNCYNKQSESIKKNSLGTIVFMANQLGFDKDLKRFL